MQIKSFVEDMNVFVFLSGAVSESVPDVHSSKEPLSEGNIPLTVRKLITDFFSCFVIKNFV